MLCPNCGKDSDSNGLFCEFCGALLPSDGLEEEIQMEEEEKHRRFLLSVIPVLVAVLLLLLAVIMSVVRQQKDRKEIRNFEAGTTVRLSISTKKENTAVESNDEAPETTPAAPSSSQDPIETESSAVGADGAAIELSPTGFIQWGEQENGFYENTDVVIPEETDLEEPSEPLDVFFSEPETWGLDGMDDDR